MQPSNLTSSEQALFNKSIKIYLSVNACSFLTKCRPLSVSMGNAITHLKFRISSISPELPESEVLISLVIHLIEPSDPRVVAFFAGQGVTFASYQRLYPREDPFG